MRLSHAVATVVAAMVVSWVPNASHARSATLDVACKKDLDAQLARHVEGGLAHAARQVLARHANPDGACLGALLEVAVGQDDRNTTLVLLDRVSPDPLAVARLLRLAVTNRSTSMVDLLERKVRRGAPTGSIGLGKYEEDLGYAVAKAAADDDLVALGVMVKWFGRGVLELKGEQAPHGTDRSDLGKEGLEGLTPLQAAAREGRLAAVRSIVEWRGPSATDIDVAYDSASRLAARGGHADVLDFLLCEAGSKLTRKSADLVLADYKPARRDSSGIAPGADCMPRGGEDLSGTSGSAPVAAGPGPVMARTGVSVTQTKFRELPTRCDDHPAMLESNGANQVGLARYAGDATFVDINLALRAPLGYDRITNYGRDCSSRHFGFMGFDMRGAFYLGTRPSSPVIIRSISPNFHYRYFLGESNIGKREEFQSEYVDAEYGHISNGQTLDTRTEFDRLAQLNGGESFARSYISRGWDYAGVSVKQRVGEFWGTHSAITIGARRYFGGIFQRHVEEFTPAIDGDRAVTRLSQVSGLSAHYEARFGRVLRPVIQSASVAWSSGLTEPLKRNSLRLELLTANLPWLDVPIRLWVSDGYMGDLAQYHVRTRAAGIAFSFETFADRK